MKILVVGNGGREHALAWKLLQSQQVEQVICAPGNGGTASMERCQNLPLKVDDFEGIGKFALEQSIDLVVVGPELPLAMGITDYLQRQGLTVFGPTKAGAQLEASKSWAKAFMQEAGIPTARAAVFTEATAAKAYVKTQGAPIVIKADGLAAGKGVTVATTVEKAQSFIDAIFQGQFAQAGKFVLVEECLTGQEVSVLALTDGSTIRPLLPAQDHKRIGENDTGANTGGMGAYAPAPIATPALMERVEQAVFTKALTLLKAKNIDYRGVLYAGLMITPTGEFKVLEFNCRFGDPEAQAILPLLETPLADLLLACAQQRLAEMPPIVWQSGAAACVVIAAGGYPGTYQIGKIITGIELAQALSACVFHAGTKVFTSGTLGTKEQLITDGGRVLGVTGMGETFDEALAIAYAAVARIQFEGMYFRRDIGHHVK